MTRYDHTTTTTEEKLPGIEGDSSSMADFRSYHDDDMDGVNDTVSWSCLMTSVRARSYKCTESRASGFVKNGRIYVACQRR